MKPSSLIDPKKAINWAIEALVTPEQYKKAYEEYHSKKCDYSLPWTGPCGKVSDKTATLFVQYQSHTFGLCDEHATQSCSKCGKPAVRGCANAGQFVCGMPLCPTCDCRH